MKAVALLLAACCCGLSAAPAERSSAVRAEFQRNNPCPATGERRGACPGYVVDHVTPLCAGGADHPSNMQWQTREAGKVKDRIERKGCEKPQTLLRP